MSFALKTPLDFVVAVALLPDGGNLFFITSWIFDCPVPALFFVPGEVFPVFDCNTFDFSSMLCWLYKCALMLEVELAQYLKVAKQILQIVLDLSVVPSKVGFYNRQAQHAKSFLHLLAHLPAHVLSNLWQKIAPMYVCEISLLGRCRDIFFCFFPLSLQKWIYSR